MTNLQKNINHYMDRKGIHFYSDLLREIAHELNFHGDDAYTFVEREKSNFSKMLQGKRPLKYEFIIPLEKIFGVSLARLLYEDAYKLPVDKDNVPIVKGFRYYAYLDDYALYEKELDVLVTKMSESSLTSTDEFDKTFIDYVVEYGSKNAVRFLRDRYHIKMRFANNQFQSTLAHSFLMWTHNGIEFARLVASIGDAELFNDIYDPYFMMISNGFYTTDRLWSKDDFQEIVMDSKPIFDSLFEHKEYDYKLSRRAQKKMGVENIIVCTINPIINTCLDYALRNLPKYKEHAIRILEYGIEHNHKIKMNLGSEAIYTTVDECGGLRRYSGYNISDVVVIVKQKDIKDKEVIQLINKLPTF